VIRSSKEHKIMNRPKDGIGAKGHELLNAIRKAITRQSLCTHA
jgi:hypothetical protein